jgi:NAD(P)-dependent dehydrogenase (short-subunit alcohol dehydrogenase family)
MKDSEIREVLDINLLAPFILIREVVKTMMKSGSGKIVNVSSVSSLRGGAAQANVFMPNKLVSGFLSPRRCRERSGKRAVCLRS